MDSRPSRRTPLASRGQAGSEFTRRQGHDPTQNFIHGWTATGGTLVLEDAGGGALRFHASGVTMAKGLVFRGATGTFTLDITGTITNVTHN